MDVGTKPREKALYHLYRAFERNPQIAGSCGQITTRNIANFSPIVAAQHFEYKMANILDKATESVFGFITVLPGAFSAYRFKALKGTPLRKYFKHIETPASEMSLFEANMYLAEDRILCFELFAKTDHNFTLHYVRDSIAETDVPETLSDLMKQRRRWINGSFFAMCYALINFWRVFSLSSHSIFRKLSSLVQLIYFTISLILNWLLMSIFFLTLFFGIKWVSSQNSAIYISSMLVFSLLIIVLFKCSSSEKPMDYKNVYIFSCVFLGILFTFMSFYTISYAIDAVSRTSSPELIVSLSIGAGIYLFAALFNGEIASLLFSFSQYWFMIPTFIIIFSIYSMCNVHDVSWGTKNIENASLVNSVNEKISQTESKNSNFKLASEKIHSTLRTFRFKIVGSWIISNVILIIIVSILNSQIGPESFLLVVLSSVVVSNGSRLFGSMFYLISHRFTRSEEADQNFTERKYFLGIRQFAQQMLKSRKEKMTLWKFLSVPFRVRTLVSISNILFLSGFFGILSAAWCIITVALSFPLAFLFPVGPFILSAFAISWRALAKFEFEYNSQDGEAARVLGIDSSSNSSESVQCPDVAVPYSGNNYGWMRSHLGDSFTWRSLFYFLIPKPIIFGIFWIFSVFFFGLSLILLMQPWMLTSCPNSSLAICNAYRSAIGSQWGSLEWAKWIFESKYALAVTIPFGLILFLLSCHFVNYFDNKTRKATSLLLGEKIVSLEARKHMILQRSAFSLRAMQLANEENPMNVSGSEQKIYKTDRKTKLNKQPQPNNLNNV